jgi:hypothetical protein
MPANSNPHLRGYAETITCPKCGNCGIMNWDYVETPLGPKEEFIEIRGDFYERLDKEEPYPIEIVCNACRILVKKQPASQP